MKNVLLISACARPESRTYAPAQKAARRLYIGYTVLHLYNENLANTEIELLKL